VIDWPLDFAMRVGFDSDGLVGKAINTIAKAATTIKDKWNYIVNYEAYLNAQGIKKQFAEQQSFRSVARTVANFMDEAQELKQQFRQLDKDTKQKNLKAYQLPEFDTLYTRSLARDKQAAMLLSSYQESIEKIGKSSKLLKTIQSYSDRYARYQTIEAIAKSSIDKSLGKLASNIDLSKDYGHIVHLASQNNMTTELLGKKIQTVQQQHKQEIWGNLCKEQPILSKYEQLVRQAAKTQGFQNEQLQKALQTIIVSIINDPDILRQLQRNLPSFTKKLASLAQNQLAHKHSQ